MLKLREWSANFGFPMTLVSDSGPAFRNRFECAKVGVRVEHNSAYNPFTVCGQFEASFKEISQYESTAVVRDGFCLEFKGPI